MAAVAAASVPIMSNLGNVTPTPQTQQADWHKFFTVEDLQLPPAVCVRQDQPLSIAQECAYERDFSILPVTSSKSRNLMGYVQFPISTQLLDSNAPVSAAMTKFARQVPYTLITPATDLDTLKKFFKGNSDNEFAIVTDPDRQFVLAVVTQEDLKKFEASFEPRKTSI